MQESLNKKSADMELYDSNDGGGDICDDDVCGGDDDVCGGDVDNYGW